MENQHQQISGYRDLGEVEINAMNEIKEHEKTFAKFYNELPDRSEINVDSTDYAEAMRHFEVGFMYLVRSIARPETPWANKHRKARR